MKVRTSKKPVIEFSSYGALNGDYKSMCFQVHSLIKKRLKSEFLRAVRLDRLPHAKYFYFPNESGGETGILYTVSCLLKELYLGFDNDDYTLKVFTVFNRPGIILYVTDHDHPVNGIEFLIVPCAESTYKRNSEV